MGSLVGSISCWISVRTFASRFNAAATAAMTETTPSPLSYVTTIDDERIKSHHEWVVRGSLEETLRFLAGLSAAADADRLAESAAECKVC